MVITIIGVIAAMVAVFVSEPVRGYLDSVRRAELTDAADSALRRLTRDVRLALPNSLRIRDTATAGACAAGTCYIEFIYTSGGGRYRADGDGSTAGETLKFGTGTASCATVSNCQFDVLGPMPEGDDGAALAAGDAVVVLNLGPGPGATDAYNCTGTPPTSGCNRGTIGGVAGNRITLAANPFGTQSPPLPSQTGRFQVVPGAVQVVTYGCPIAAAGPMTRQWGYGFGAVQAAPPAGGTTAQVLANATCAVNYVTLNARAGLLFVRLNVIDPDSGEQVSVFQQIHVDNSP